MTRHRLAVIGSLLFLGVACQAPAVSVSPTEVPPTDVPTEVAAPVAASTAIWGEVPKQCA